MVERAMGKQWQMMAVQTVITSGDRRKGREGEGCSKSGVVGSSN